MKRTNLKIMALCIAAGIATFATEVVVVWNTSGSLLTYGTYDRLRDVQFLIKIFVTQFGRIPVSMEEALGGTEVTDHWGRAYRLMFREDRPVAYSLGRDDEPGGFGVDADSYSDQPETTNGGVSLVQFLSVPSTRLWLLGAALTGVAVAVACWIPARRHVRGASAAQFWVPALVFAGLALVAAHVMAFLHTDDAGNH